MDYDDGLTQVLTGIVQNCKFIYPVADYPGEITEDNLGCEDSTFGETKVEDFQKRRKGSAGFALKKWNELTLLEQKKLMVHLSKLDQSDGEQALAIDLILYTMGAPGYETISEENSPATLNDNTGFYTSKREGIYDKKFTSLNALVVREAANGPNAKNESGWTVLMSAIQERNNTRVQELLNAGADIEAETGALYELDKNGVGFVQSYDVNKAATLTPLIVAVRLGNVEAVKMLLDKGVDVFAKDSRGITALDWVEQSIQNTSDENKRNDFIAIKNLLQQTRREDNLIEAVIAGDYARVDELIKNGADVNEETDSLYDVVDGKFTVAENGITVTPLILAARSGNVEIVKRLLAAQANVYQRDSSDRTALDWVNLRLDSEQNPAFITSFSQIKELLEAAQGHQPKPKEDINEVVHRFIDALENGQKEQAIAIFEEYKKNPEFLDWKDEEGTPLWSYVLDYNNEEISRLFVNSGADLTVRNEYGETPMHLVMAYGNKGLLPDLLKKGLDINEKDSRDQTPLHQVYSGQTTVETIEAFITSGAQVNPTDKDGYTPLDYVYSEINTIVAAEGGISEENLLKFKSYMDVLLKHGAKSSKVQLSDQAKVALNIDQEPKAPTVEEFFAELRKDEVNSQTVKDLLERGAKAYINEFDPKEGVPTSGMTPVAIAVMRGDVELLRTFIAKEADVNKPSKDGQTPLALALQELKKAEQSGNADKIKVAEEIVKTLREAGAKDKEEPIVEVDTLARQEGESLSDWYKRVATYWRDEEAEVRTQLATEQDETKRNELTEKATAQHKLAETYDRLHALETSLASETDPEKKKELLTELTQLSGLLMQGISGYYAVYHKDVLTDPNNPLTIQGRNQVMELKKASTEYQKAITALSQEKGPKDGERPAPDDTTRGGDGSDAGHTPMGPGSQPEVNVGDVPKVDKPTDPTAVTPALVDSVAHAKHDGAQEKSWWERNQEWIWWALGIIVAAVLGYFGFRKGGWFNKDKKKTTTTSNSNSNENSNSNTNTDNNNTNTDSGNTGTDSNTGSTNDTLANSGKLYSTQEVNSAIAANLQNIINRE